MSRARKKRYEAIGGIETSWKATSDFIDQKQTWLVMTVHAIPMHWLYENQVTNRQIYGGYFLPITKPLAQPTWRIDPGNKATLKPAACRTKRPPYHTTHEWHPWSDLTLWPCFQGIKFQTWGCNLSKFQVQWSHFSNGLRPCRVGSTLSKKTNKKQSLFYFSEMIR